ncbi:NADH:flavin oxidoreductase [Idiomarina sp. A28L]|uniref:alkene reductase n=1 Tax=Idiomarina sp. A28L TaxID=1036674 RepID=UPI0002138741|nr:alkene reductase [Idiomarina sp. A28L]EGN76410.1 NADH:flavin oxidoreductase [Idiomarina sp. A28L]
MSSALFESFPLNSTISLANRFVMAPLTRCMAGPGLVPTDIMAEYYGRRADAGLIISEATIIRADAQGYPDTPGIFNDEQIAGWKKITQKVHANGGKIFMQLWHVGRVAHSHFSGLQPVAPSAVKHEGTLPRMRDLSYEMPKALTHEDIQQLVTDYVTAAQNAMAAGFDGVEIHGANGYLIDQFLHFDTNKRTDEYGETPENMSRFALQVVDAVSAAVGAERTALRITPGAYAHIAPDARDREVFDYFIEQLNQRELAYLHLGIFDDSMTFEHLGGRSSTYIRERYQGTFMSVGGLTPETAAQGIANNEFDLAAIGRPFIANPDFIQRVRENTPLVEYNNDMLAELI